MDDEIITATGASGAKYSFYVYPWGTDLRQVGGVYMILRKESQNGNYDVLYVGQTNDLSERFDNHHKQPCFDRNRKTHIAAMVEPSEVRRLKIEADLIKKYNPSCNS
jgi:excinuclease UvrABC nuclease subunit